VSDCSLPPCFVLDLDRLIKVRLERAAHRLADLVIENQEIALGVEVKGSEVKMTAGSGLSFSAIVPS
jgi:hypothetical protein